MEQFKNYLNSLHVIIQKLTKIVKKIDKEEFTEWVDYSVKITKNKTLELIDDYPNYEKIIKNKDDEFNVNINGDTSGVIMDNSLNNNNLNQSLIMNTSNTSDMDNLRMSFLQVAEIQSNEQFMKKREEELQGIHM
jgi:hypothetical protein